MTPSAPSLELLDVPQAMAYLHYQTRAGLAGALRTPAYRLLREARCRRGRAVFFMKKYLDKHIEQELRDPVPEPAGLVTS